MCMYCEPEKTDEYGASTGKYIKGIPDRNGSGMWFMMTNDRHFLRSHGAHGVNEIFPNYCPMCGQKVNEGITLPDQ